ncbi:Uncharacterised protein [Mycobacteroides abscessus subsp. massiliense]|nr:Uncharacterised protein [Mycobacteroides abscessus subsp. massiliense]SKE63143.1 Uncharacterised protein [Mycobacteroides abscessus subsp. massiliense]
MRGLIPALLRPLLPAGTLNPLITDRRSLRVIDRDRAVLIQRRLIDPTLIIRHLTRHLRRLKLRSIRPIGATIGATPTIRRTLRMRLGHRGRSKPAQTQPTRREHQQRNNTRHRGRLMRSISSPLPQTRKPFPPTQIGSDRPQQHRDNRRDSRQHIRTGNPHIQPGRDPGGQQYQTHTAPDQRGHQTRMPHRLVPVRAGLVTVRASPFATGSAVACPEHPGIGQNLCGQAGEVLTACEQGRSGKDGHQHLSDTEQQCPAGFA